MEQSDLNAAYLFAEVVQQQSFTRAAHALGVPKSTVSRKISELEQRLGARLLHRTTRKLNLTDVGAAYYERVKRIVSDLSEAEAAVSLAQGQPRGLLRVTAPPDIGTVMLASALPDFSALYPEVQVSLDLSRYYRDLVGEGIDVALRAGRLVESSLVAKPVFAGNFGLYASPGYLDARGRPTAAADLVHHACLVFGVSPDVRWTLENKSEKREVAIHGRVSAEDFGYLRQTAVAGAGIALLPTFLVGPDVHFGRLERVLPDFASVADTLYVVYPTREFLPAKTRAFVDFVSARFAEWNQMCQRGGPSDCNDDGALPLAPRAAAR